MRKTVNFMVLFAVLTVVMPDSSYAQAKLSSEEVAKNETERMKEKLNLSDEQTTKVEAINLKYAEESHQVREQSGEESTANREVMHEKMKELHKRKREELKQVLSAEQFEQYKQMEEALHKEHERH